MQIRVTLSFVIHDNVRVSVKQNLKARGPPGLFFFCLFVFSVFVFFFLLLLFCFFVVVVVVFYNLKATWLPFAYDGQKRYEFDSMGSANTVEQC